MPKQIDARQLDAYSVQLVDLYRELEDNAFRNMARLLKDADNRDKQYALQWQAERLQELGLLNTQTLKDLAETVGLARTELARLFNELFDDTIFTVDGDVKKLVDSPITETGNLQNLMNSFVDGLREDLDNLVNARLINNNGQDGFVTDMAKRVIERTTSEALTGDLTINQALAKTVIKFREIGLDSGFVDRSGRRWTVRRYAENVIRTTVNNAYNELSERRQKEYGIDLVLVDYYQGARPACQLIQGKVASLSNPSSNPKYPSIYEFKYKQPDGIRGIHCRHKLIPFVDGVSTNNLHPPSVEEANERYKLEQRQRELERSIRSAKLDLELADEIDDEDQINRAKKLIRDRQTVLREFVKSNELIRRRDREQIL